jgi:hypothetical protein
MIAAAGRVLDLPEHRVEVEGGRLQARWELRERREICWATIACIS